jgi:hypothetical protein
VAFSPDCNTLATASADATVRLWHAPPVLPEVRKLADSPSVAPVETIFPVSLNIQGTARATMTSEGNVHRVNVTAVDDTDWHVLVAQVFDDLRDGATYTVRFRAKSDASRRMKLEGQINEPDWHSIGLKELVDLTEKWQTYQYDFQARGITALNAVIFGVGDRTGTVWIADFTVTKVAK